MAPTCEGPKDCYVNLELLLSSIVLLNAVVPKRGGTHQNVALKKIWECSKTELLIDEILFILVLTYIKVFHLAIIMQSKCHKIMQSWNMIVAHARFNETARIALLRLSA
jgi:hypothetical protein